MSDSVPMHALMWARSEHESRGVSGLAALLAIVIVAGASWVSWVGIGTDCVNALSSGPAAAGVCEVEVGNSTSTSANDLHDYLILALPLLIVLGGVAYSRALGRKRAFWLASLAAIIVLIAPWLILLAD
jgi:hypothetical protein